MNTQKYPRTPHLPSSPGCTTDDKRLSNVDDLLNRVLVQTEKMDGSNVCMESSACFSRSHAGAPSHPSFDLFKALHAGVRHLIPQNFQIFGEWLYARHSIQYTNLPSYFMVFGVRDTQKGLWASWSEVEMWAGEIGFPTVPVIGYLTSDHHTFGQSLLDLALPSVSAYGPETEGFVLRWASDFKDEDFSKAVAKYVRKNHVQTSDHWSHQEIVRNGLRIG